MAQVVFCLAMYLLMVSEETLPAVDKKYDRVHMLGIRRRCWNSLRNTRDVYPLILNMIWSGARFGEVDNLCQVGLLYELRYQQRVRQCRLSAAEA